MSDKKISNVLIGLTMFLVLLSITMSFIRFIILQDYIVFAKIPCDPKLESCFIEECDTLDPRCDQIQGVNVFKIIYKSANMIPPIDSCSENERECEIVLCSEEILEEYAIEGECTILEENESSESDLSISAV
jgi:hypothetical protein